MTTDITIVLIVLTFWLAGFFINQFIRKKYKLKKTLLLLPLNIIIFIVIPVFTVENYIRIAGNESCAILCTNINISDRQK